VIPGLPQVGATELIILLSIILLFFGAKRIPELARWAEASASSTRAPQRMQMH
jgi:Sec-independent protein translocase protein TatA